MISRTWKRMALVVMPTIAVAIVAVTGAKADPILTVTNGEFTQYSGTTPGTSGDYFTNVMPTSWSGGGNLIFVTTSIQNPNSTYQQFGVNDPNLYIPVYGPTATVTASPSNPISNPIPGSNFVEADGNPTYEDSFSYQLSGLTVGQTYQLSFYEAFGQDSEDNGYFSGATTNQWIVALGTQGSSLQTPYIGGGYYSYYDTDSNASVTSPGVVNIASQSFSGWQQVTVNLTADASNDVLTFLAWGDGGNSANLPPMAFLDIGNNGAPAATPEPATLTLMAIGMVGFGAFRLRRRRSNLTTV
jgi:hypothetical protein